MTKIDSDLTGRSILIVEDEYMIASDMASTLERSGVHILGPVPTIDRALEIIAQADRIDGAVLDINLRGELAYAVADVLSARGVPFVFTTGYDQAAVPADYRHIPRCEKPIDPADVTAALFPPPPAG